MAKKIYVSGKITGRDFQEALKHFADASKMLREKGFEGRVWTNSYDKRYCFDEETLQTKIGYVQKHGC